MNFQSVLKKTALTCLIVSTMVVGCKKDDDKKETPVVPNEEEVITTLRYTLTPVTGGDVATLLFQDLDGDGGNDPVFTVEDLIANMEYIGELELLNESESPAEDITEEVKEEAAEHQFFYEAEAATNVNITYNDNDSDGNPIGLSTKFVTSDPGTGKLKITLRHEPNKSADGVKEGAIANAGGETDIEVTFNLSVK